MFCKDIKRIENEKKGSKRDKSSEIANSEQQQFYYFRKLRITELLTCYDRQQAAGNIEHELGYKMMSIVMRETSKI